MYQLAYVREQISIVVGQGQMSGAIYEHTVNTNIQDNQAGSFSMHCNSKRPLQKSFLSFAVYGSSFPERISSNETTYYRRKDATELNKQPLPSKKLIVQAWGSPTLCNTCNYRKLRELPKKKRHNQFCRKHIFTSNLKLSSKQLFEGKNQYFL